MRTNAGRCRSNLVKRGYSDESDHCSCGVPQAIEHLLVCENLPNSCSRKDIANANSLGLDCARYWVDKEYDCAWISKFSICNLFSLSICCMIVVLILYFIFTFTISFLLYLLDTKLINNYFHNSLKCPIPIVT